MKTTLAVLLLICVFSFNAFSARKKDSKPNIILIMSDDHGWFDAGFNGNTIVKTPRMDEMAASGLVFDRFYSASAVCSPTRASVMTGRNPYRINIPTANKGHLLTEEYTLAELLKEEGYVTGHFGKWHLGTLTQTVLDANRGGKETAMDEFTIPTQHGYDQYFSTESKVPTYNPMEYPIAFSDDESKRYGWCAVEDGAETKHFNTRYWDAENSIVTSNLEGDDSRIIMDRVIPFIEKAHGNKESFFTTIWMHTPHLPVVCDKAHRDMYPEQDLQTQLYYGAITAMDEQIGRLWDVLKTLDIDEETIIFYCSDNGPEERTPGQTASFRGRKRSLYEGGLRVPAFVLWPGHVASGQRVTTPAVTSDYLPTMLDVLDLSYPDDRPLDGQSIKPIITGCEDQREKAIGFAFGDQISWVDMQYKLISQDKGTTFELYDILEDKEETNDIIAQHPALAEKMEVALREWLASVKNSSQGGDY